MTRLLFAPCPPCFRPNAILSLATAHGRSSAQPPSLSTRCKRAVKGTAAFVGDVATDASTVRASAAALL
eukprot:3374384-Pleurochrysis_carterae.AAC.3